MGFCTVGVEVRWDGAGAESTRGASTARFIDAPLAPSSSCMAMSQNLHCSWAFERQLEET